jgi:uncharacterized membrane protein YbhN (UPF0104 family)
VVFAIDRAVAAGLGEIRHRHPLHVFVGSIVVLGIAAVLAWVIRRRTTAELGAVIVGWFRGRRRAPVAERRAAGRQLHLDVELLLGTRPNRLWVGALGAAAWLTDAAVLWAMLAAVRVHVHFTIAVIAYVVAVLASWVPFLPSGVGVVELAVPALLHRFHVPITEGLAAVVLWRLMSTVLPALVGLFAWSRIRAPRHAPDVDGSPIHLPGSPDTALAPASLR